MRTAGECVDELREGGRGGGLGAALGAPPTRGGQGAEQRQRQQRPHRWAPAPQASAHAAQTVLSSSTGSRITVAVLLQIECHDNGIVATLVQSDREVRVQLRNSIICVHSTEVNAFGPAQKFS